MKKLLLCLPVLLLLLLNVRTPSGRETGPEASAPTEAPAQIVVACIGDSITYGAGVPQTHRPETYPRFLQDLLGDGYLVLNYGLSGRTLMRSGDYPYVDESYYPLSLELEADIYIVLLGSNDARGVSWREAGENGEVFRQELTELVRSYQDLPSAPTVYLLQPPRAFVSEEEPVPDYAISDALIRGPLREIIPQVAESTGARFLDLYALTEDHPEWYSDGLHFNAEGNRRMAEAIYAAMQN